MHTGIWTTVLALASLTTTQGAIDYSEPRPFGEATEFAKDCDNLAIGEWWTVDAKTVGARSGGATEHGDCCVGNTVPYFQWTIVVNSLGIKPNG